MTSVAPAATRPRPARHAAFGPLAIALCWIAPVIVTWESSPDLGHSWAVPLLMAYLWWERWCERPAALTRTSPSWPWWLAAALIGSLELPLRLLLVPFPLWPLLVVLFTGLFALVALLFGWLWGGRAGVRWIAGPLLLLLTALPTPSFIESSIILPLRATMAGIAADISNLFGHPAVASGTSIQLVNTWVGVDEACGGIRSLQACVMIGLFFGEWYRFSLGRRLSLIALGGLAALLGNFTRVLFLSLHANAGAKAVESAHDLAGWVAMGTSLVLTGWLACHWADYRWPEQKIHAREATAPSAAWAWIAAVGAFFVANDLATRWWFSAAPVENTHADQWTVRLPEEAPLFHREPLSEYARAFLHPDEFRAAQWLAGPDTYVFAYYIEWRRGQMARSAPFLHNPTVCLPISGCELVETLDPISVSWRNTTIPFQAYKFRRAGENILVAFAVWDPARGRLLARPSDTRSWHTWPTRWEEVRAARQHQPAQMLTMSAPWRDDMAAQVQSQLSRLLFEPNQTSENFSK